MYHTFIHARNKRHQRNTKTYTKVKLFADLVYSQTPGGYISTRATKKAQLRRENSAPVMHLVVIDRVKSNSRSSRVIYPHALVKSDIENYSTIININQSVLKKFVRFTDEFREG